MDTHRPRIPNRESLDSCDVDVAVAEFLVLGSLGVRVFVMEVVICEETEEEISSFRGDCCPNGIVMIG